MPADFCQSMPEAWLLVGCRGSGVRSFGRLLRQAGHSVIGMDGDQSPITCDEQFITQLPWTNSPNWSQLNVTRVVASQAIPDDSPLLCSARREGLTVESLPVALGSLLSSYSQICVAGTHGKSTTAAMTAWILNHAGLSPASFIGAELSTAWPSPASSGEQIAVVESCEYRRAFLSLRPTVAVLTGIERDHVDCFRDDNDVRDAFQSFLERTMIGGVIVANAECERSLEAAQLANRADVKLVTWSLRQADTISAQPATRRIAAAHWTATRLSRNTMASGRHDVQEQFELQTPDGERHLIRLQTPGRHNVANATAAIIAAHAAGVSIDAAAEAMHSFPGLRRRFENRGVVNDVQLIDDYAHHPSAIRETLLTARGVFPGRRIIAVFEPHQLSRLTALFRDFKLAVSLADECLVLPVLPARETVGHDECLKQSGLFVRALTNGGARAYLMANLDQVLSRLDDSARPGDVIITLGAGRTDWIHDELTRRIRRHSAA